jgi:hypothetical protein
MIRMPRRSVTRFFIPLIDVLLLLFCIFLLMPLYGEEGKGTADAEELKEKIRSLEKELQLRKEELQKFESVQPELLDLIRLQDEVDRLRKEKIQALQKRLLIRVLDIDERNGDLTFFDPSNLDQPIYKINQFEDAKALIEKHKREAPEREQFYQFYLPRGSGYPTRAQAEQYQRWFESVANSFHKKEKLE